MLTIIIGLSTAALLWYEINQMVRGKPTISEQTWGLSKRYPPFSFAMGTLAGHLFWPAYCALVSTWLR